MLFFFPEIILQIQGFSLGEAFASALGGSATYFRWTGQGSAREHDCNMGLGKKYSMLSKFLAFREIILMLLAT